MWTHGTATGACTVPDTTHIPATSVYFPKCDPDNPTHCPPLVNTMANHNQGESAVDYAAFRIVDHQHYQPANRTSFLRLRRSGILHSDDHFAMTSHPAQLLMKLQYGLHYQGDYTGQDLGTPPYSFTRPSFDKFYALFGTSGSPVYNLTQSFVDSMEVQGAGCVRPQFPPSSCADVTHVVVTDACATQPLSPESGGPSESSIKEYFAPLLATFTPELRVSPLDPVVYPVPSGTTSNPTPTTYSFGGSPISVSATVDIEPPPAGQPPLTFINLFTPYTITLAATQTQQFHHLAQRTVQPHLRHIRSACRVTDNTNGFVDRIRHRFEVGLTDFTVDGQAVQTIHAITAPSMPTSIAYNLSNPRPTPATVKISSGQPWLGLSTLSGSGFTPGVMSLSLAANGQSGSKKTVYAGLLPSAYALPNGEYDSTITFADSSQCAVTNQLTRGVHLSKGSLTFSSSIQQFVPSPTPLTSPVGSLLSVPQTFCITAATLEIDDVYQLFGGIRLAQWYMTFRSGWIRAALAPILCHSGTEPTSCRIGVCLLRQTRIARQMYFYSTMP